MEFWEFAKAHLGKLLICHYGWDKGAKTVKIISVAIYSRSNLRLTGLNVIFSFSVCMYLDIMFVNKYTTTTTMSLLGALTFLFKQHIS